MVPKFSLSFKSDPRYLFQVYPVRSGRNIFTSFQLNSLQRLSSTSGSPANLLLGQQEEEGRNQRPEYTPAVSPLVTSELSSGVTQQTCCSAPSHPPAPGVAGLC